MRKTIRNILIILCMFSMVMVLFFGCAANKGVTTNHAPVEPAKLTLDEDADIEYMIDAYDPWEGFNRQIYIFNYYFDEYFFVPVVNAYEFILPDYIENRISSFFLNLDELKNFTNCLFQLKAKDTGVTLGRFLTNSTIGIAGFYDPATHFGWQRRHEDFGQTLGHYGSGPGPYLVLPVFGPSSLRDGSGLLADTSIRSLVYNFDINSYILLGIYGIESMDTRHTIKFRYYKSGSPFEYELIRRLYLNMRKIQIAK